MATRKITITVDAAELDRIRALVADGQASSVSGFVQTAVRRSLDAETLFRSHLDSILAETGGAPTDQERAWLDEVLPQ